MAFFPTNNGQYGEPATFTQYVAPVPGYVVPDLQISCSKGKHVIYPWCVYSSGMTLKDLIDRYGGQITVSNGTWEWVNNAIHINATQDNAVFRFTGQYSTYLTIYYWHEVL